MTLVPGPAVGFHRLGATFGPEGVVFKVWAPRHQTLVAVVDGRTQRRISLEPVGEGYFEGVDPEARPGDRYGFELDGKILPDPASRFQPEGVQGRSEIIDPTAYPWQATHWRRPPLRGRVIYELHVGTFTSSGTFRDAAAKLDALVDLGINTLELMPLGDFSGRWNWGYDGVMLYAPARCYGRPDDLRYLIDAAHQRGLGVIIDVVYNHLGPTGNVLPFYADEYFHREHQSQWGTGLNFDGPRSAAVREFFLQNARMWFDEYRVDGLRLDAVHAIHDSSNPPLVAEIALAAQERGAFVIAEDERNDVLGLTPCSEGGHGMDGVWADDFHHTLRVTLAGEQHGHFRNYRGGVDEVVTCLRRGWIYCGQHFTSWQRGRGTPCDHLPPEKLIICISNHDQAGNRPCGDRLSEVISPAAYRAASVLLCLAPYTPMIFQGQEWAASTPFPFFSDHPGAVGADMAANRRREFELNQAAYPEEVLARMPDPQDGATFDRARLQWSERNRRGHAEVLALYRACLRLRDENGIFQSPARDHWTVQKLNATAFALRWHDGGDRWSLFVSVAEDAGLPTPAPAEAWELILDSNASQFGGTGETSGPRAMLWRRFSRQETEPNR